MRSRCGQRLLRGDSVPKHFNSDLLVKTAANEASASISVVSSVTTVNQHSRWQRQRARSRQGTMTCGFLASELHDCLPVHRVQSTRQLQFRHRPRGARRSWRFAVQRRAATYCITKDTKLTITSEAGVVDLKNKDVVEKGCVSPGKMLWNDLVTRPEVRPSRLPLVLAKSQRTTERAVQDSKQGPRERRRTSANTNSALQLSTKKVPTG